MFWKQKRGWFGNQLEENIKNSHDGVNRLSWIFCVFAENHNNSKLKAARVLKEILDNYSFSDIIRTDESMRHTTSTEWSIDWRKYSINNFFTAEMNLAERRAVTVFASFSPNGFIRERAVVMLREYDGILPYIFLRLNDWVKQVREAAISAFKYRLGRLSNGEILAALPFAEKLKYGLRVSHSEQLDLFFATLNKPENEYALIKGLESNNIRTRRMCTEIICNEKSLNLGLAFDRLARETDPFLRATIFRKLTAIGQKVDKYVDLFLIDKYPTNRLLAFQYLIDAKASNRLEIAKRFLLDKSAVVRGVVQKVVQEHTQEFDFRKFYIDNLATNPIPSICGLSEKGLPKDTAEIEKYLTNIQVGVVKSAMTSLIRLNQEKYIAIITEFLNAKQKGVVKIARNLIIKNSPDYKRIKEIFTASTFEHTKLKCLDILFSASKWVCLIYMLQAMSDKNEMVKEKTLAAIQRWIDCFNRSFVSPSETQRIEIRELIDRLQKVLPSDFITSILFVLR